MKKKIISDAITNISSEYIEKAADYTVAKKSCKPVWLKWGALAACLVLMIIAPTTIRPNLGQPGISPPDNPDSTIILPENQTETISNNQSDVLHVNLDDIAINQLGGFTNTDYARYNPETANEVIWDNEDVVTYLGMELTPAYIPKGLFASSENASIIVYYEQDGTIVEDTIRYDFYHDFYEDGGAKHTDDVVACYGFSISASKLGLVKDCFYLAAENEVKTSEIGGTKVIFGYRSMPYGSDNNNPIGYYDLYVAEFELNGIEYQLIFEQMDIGEVVKVVSSIIYEKEVAVDD